MLKIRYHFRNLFGQTYRIFRYIGMKLSESGIIGCIQHSAVGVAAAVD